MTWQQMVQEAEAIPQRLPSATPCLTCLPHLLLTSFWSSAPMRIIQGLQSLREGPAPAGRNGTRWLISSFLTECPAALAIETLYFMLNTTLLAIFNCLMAGATQSHHSFGRKGNHKLDLCFVMEHWCFENIINQTSHAKPICSVELKTLYIICFLT